MIHTGRKEGETFHPTKITKKAIMKKGMMLMVGGYGPFRADNGGLEDERTNAIILPAIYCIIVR